MPKSQTDYEKGEAYLQSSLQALKELATLLESERLSASEKASFVGAYTNNKRLYDETTKIRDQLLTQRKSLRKIIINFFVRDADAKRFHKVSYWSYTSIKRTSDGLNRLLLPEFGNPGESAQGNESTTGGCPSDRVEDNLPGVNLDVHTEQKTPETGVAIPGEDDQTRSPCDAVDGNINISAEDVSPNKNHQDINVDLHTEQDVREAIAMLGQFGPVVSTEEADDDDDDDEGDNRTIRPSSSYSRAPSPTPSQTTINFYITQSVVSFDSESSGSTLNIKVDKGLGSSF